MGKRLLTILGAVAIVLAGATGTSRVYHGLKEKHDKYEAAYSMIEELADTDGRDGTTCSEMNRIYTIITGDPKVGGCRKMTFEEMDRYLESNGFELNEDSMKYSFKD